MSNSSPSNGPDECEGPVPPSFTYQPQPQPQGFATRPQLIRIDSRNSLRPAFQGQVRTAPPTGTQYIQRAYYPPRLPNPNQGFVATNPPVRLINNGGPRQLINRPPIYQRLPPGTPQRPQGIYPQRSLPVTQQGTYPPYQMYRSQTLDSSDPVQNYQQYAEEVEKPSLSTLKSKPFSMSGGNFERPTLTEDRRKSIGNIEEKPKELERPASRQDLKKIEEDDDLATNLSHKVLSTVSNSMHQNEPIKEKKDEEKPPPPPPPPELIQEPKEVKKIEKTTDLAQNKMEDVKGKSDSPKTIAAKIPRSEGDNDSGVDESTQGNYQLGTDSPKKSTSTPRSSVTPTKGRSFSKGPKSPHLKSPESPTPGSAEKKKVPMNKIQVGTAASPNLKEVRSKIGSLQNTTHKPGGGHVKIEHRKVDFSTTNSRIAAKNSDYTPGGGDKKIQQQKLTWNAQSKIGSLENTTHKPKGGEKKIESIKLDFKDKAKSKVGSKDNIKYVPGGGDVKIETKKIDIKVQSKVGSLNNVKYKPGGGDKKIFDDKNYLKQRSTSAHSNTSINGSQSLTRPNSIDIVPVGISLMSSSYRREEKSKTNASASRPQSRLARNKSRSQTPRPPWKY